jgi:PLP dependent protein
MQTDLLRDRIEAVQTRIAEAAHRVGRDPSGVRLIAVTKEHPIETVQAALACGLREFGENRVEALIERTRAVPDAGVHWHMIGRLQRRAAPGLHGHAHWVHSVDSIRLGERLASTAPPGYLPLRILLQVNTSGELQKGGVEPDEAVEVMGRLLELPALDVRGLMTMAPFVGEPHVLRSTFSGLREVQRRLEGELPGYRGRELSMGMSNDFELAVEEGSTMVRIGTTLFGERDP